MILLTYLAGAAVTASVIASANRVTGQNYAYLAAATAVWPAWMVMYGLTDTH
jgi:hypothetical protein